MKPYGLLENEEIREGDAHERDELQDGWVRPLLLPVANHWIGRSANKYKVNIFRPLTVPSFEEVDKSTPCESVEQCPITDITCDECRYKTMLKLMGLSDQTKGGEG